MTKLQWDLPKERRYEAGCDRGILFLSEDKGVAWNGLIGVEEASTLEISPLYFDGRKHNDLVEPGEYRAKLKAFTYPDEWLLVEGIQEVEKGMFATNQAPCRFGLSYRTFVGNQTEGQEADYKIHVVYNCLAVADPKSFSTISDSPEALEFSWDITAVPQSLDGFTATAHLIFDTRFMDPQLLGDIEDLLYGTDSTDPTLPTVQAFSSYIRKWARIIIQDNGDGTWTAITAEEDQVTDNLDGTFTLHDANATLNDPEWTIDSSEPELGDI